MLFLGTIYLQNRQVFGNSIRILAYGNPKRKFSTLKALS